jgi:hypothetical protein
MASLSPLGAMRQNPVSASAKLSENMSQFMAQSAIDFRRMVNQPRIQRNEFLAIVSATGSCFET